MPTLNRKTRNRVAVCLCVLAGAPPLHAAERITLRNGFSLDCQDHTDAGEGLTRLTLAGGTGTMDVQSNSIRSIERIEPARPAQARTRAAAAGATAQSTDTTGTKPGTTSSLGQLIASAGTAHNINVALLQSVVNAESGGRVRAVSHAGAQGLMQLMPSTALSLGVHDSFVPEDNLGGGATYLDQLLTRYHNDLALALAAYNAGPGAVDRYHGVPPFRETVAYVSRIIREFNRRTLVEQQRSAVHPHVLAGATLP